MARFCFYHCVVTGRPAGFPLVLGVDVPEARLPQLLRTLADGRYLDRRRSRELLAQVR